MEEIQSTEVLDHEILEDARKKAYKILKNADEDSGARVKIWERKLAKARDEARKNYGKKIETIRGETMARLPMDRQRIYTDKIRALLGRAMDLYIQSLERGKLFALLEKEFFERIALCRPGGKTILRYRGLDDGELETLLSKMPDKPALAADSLDNIEGTLPALVLENSAVRVTVSVFLAARELLLEKRFELAAALLGDALNGGVL
ncbi:MAG: ATPase [Treponema sp.]|jgi:vacuolar-type H+-ATPase subunit H|nr:ATPase [Treponema sp.]